MQKIRFIDILRLLGSVASITGISLLWMKSTFDVQTLLFKIPIVALLVLFSLGITSIRIIVIRLGYQEFAKKWDHLLRFTCFSLTIPIISLILGGAIYFIWMMALQEIG